MMMSLGPFIFETATATYRELARKTAWRHAESDRFGARAASQYVGPGAETLSLPGTIAPGVTGNYASLDHLHDMADQGEAWPLVDTAGLIHGNFIITDLEETSSHFLPTGEPRKIDFALQLRRVA